MVGQMIQLLCDLRKEGWNGVRVCLFHNIHAY